MISYRTWHMHHTATIKDGHDNQGFLEVVSCQKNLSVNFYISAYAQSFDWTISKTAYIFWNNSKFCTDFKFGRLFSLSKQKLLHILFRDVLLDHVIGNCPKLISKIVFKQHFTLNQSFTQLRGQLVGDVQHYFLVSAMRWNHSNRMICDW